MQGTRVQSLVQEYPTCWATTKAMYHNYWVHDPQTACHNYWNIFPQLLKLFNLLLRFVIAFLPRSKGLLISWLQSWSTVILEPKKINYATLSIFSSSVCLEEMGLDAIILFFFFWILSFKPAFLLSSFTFIKKLFSSPLLLPLESYHLHVCGCWYFSQQSWFQFVIHLSKHFAWCTLHMT